MLNMIISFDLVGNMQSPMFLRFPFFNDNTITVISSEITEFRMPT